MTDTHRFCIPATHPALPGHFPGSPIVPGAVIVDELLAAAQAHDPRYGRCDLVQIRFLSPLRPDEMCTIDFDDCAKGLRFVCACADRKVASGILARVENPT